MTLVVPADALVMLVGAAASGKSSWARSHFRETQVVSSDHCRALVSDDEADQSASPHAFPVFYQILRGRAALRRLSVADSTALHPAARARMRAIARHFRVPHLAVVLPVPLEVLLERNAARPRRVPPEVLRRHAEQVDWLLQDGALHAEGYDAVHVLRGDEPVSIGPPAGPGPDPAPPPAASDIRRSPDI